MPTHEDLGQAVRRLRRAHHLSIEALAFAAEMHPTYLSAIERGERNPSWAKICALAGALHLSVCQLVQTAEVEAEVAQAIRDTRARLTREHAGG